MKQEVYRSTTLGDIPLSFTGRRFLQNLRDDIEAAGGFIGEAVLIDRP